MKTSTVIPALPGYFVCCPMGAKGSHDTLYTSMDYEPVLAWLIDVSTREDGELSYALPMPVTVNGWSANGNCSIFAQAGRGEMIKQPNGHFVLPEGCEFTDEAAAIDYATGCVEQRELMTRARRRAVQ